MSTLRLIPGFGLLLLLLQPSGAGAQPAGVVVDAGIGVDKTRMQRIAVRFDFDRRWWGEKTWQLSPHLELGAGRWKGDRRAGSTLPDSLAALMATPVLRLERKKPWRGQVTPFLEVGIGATYISETKLQDSSVSGRNFGGHFQFEDKIAAGVLLGHRQQFSIALSGYHYSNADIYRENDGIDFLTLSLRWQF